MIRFHKAGKSFGDAVALQAIDLKIEANKTTVLIGLSGSGKSTILRLISGLIEPTTGWIEINGKRLTRDTLLEMRRRMGYVIQSGDLFPHLTARRNISLVAEELRMGMEEITARMEQSCALTRFPSRLLDRYPVELSGGEQRRVSLTRALMLKPDILLLITSWRPPGLAIGSCCLKKAESFRKALLLSFPRVQPNLLWANSFALKWRRCCHENSPDRFAGRDSSIRPCVRWETRDCVGLKKIHGVLRPDRTGQTEPGERRF